MSVLGKDLFDFQRSHTNTKVEFGASGYWVEMVPEMQPYGTVLTEILNLDVTPFQKLLDRLKPLSTKRIMMTLRVPIWTCRRVLDLCRSTDCI